MFSQPVPEDSQGIPAGRGEGGAAAFESHGGKRGGRRHIADPVKIRFPEQTKESRKREELEI